MPSKRFLILFVPVIHLFCIFWITLVDPMMVVFNLAFFVYLVVVGGFALAIALMIRSRWTGGDGERFMSGLGKGFLVGGPIAASALVCAALIGFYILNTRRFQRIEDLPEIWSKIFLPYFVSGIPYIALEFYVVILLAFLFDGLMRATEEFFGED